MRALYIKMKTATGNSVYRNVAPQSGSAKLSFAKASSPGSEGSYASAVANAFVPIQTETPDIKDGKFQFKVVEERYFDFAEEDPVTIPGTDSWEDTTDEKLVTFLTDGDKSYTVKLSHAASAAPPGETYIPSVRDYASKIARYFRTADVDTTVEGSGADWTSVHLTGTKDSLVAQPD